MRTIVLIPAMLILAAGGGLAVARIMNWSVNVNALSLAGAIALGASTIALAPLALARHATQLGMSQASLVATMLHLFVIIAAAAVVVLGRFAAGEGFLYWLMAFYFTTLIALVVVLVRAVKAAPMTSGPPADKA
jgi:hypothetical protein